MNSEKKRRRAANIQLDRETQALIIEWQDGSSSRFSLEELRSSCPCANCKEARAQASAPTGISMLQGDAATATSQVRGIERAGRYALRITWADGHDYGIYTFESLRARADAAN
jgi:DUF971 family protein